MKPTFRKTPPKKRKTITEKGVKELLPILTKWYNLYIRLRDQKDGVFECISCNQIKPVAQMDCGHYLSAGHNAAVRFDEQNTWGQCRRCNMFLSGNAAEYRKSLVQKIGEDAVNSLEIRAKMRGFKWDRFSLLVKIEEYKTKCKQIG